MARRPFDPADHGLSDKVVYQRGDVLDRPSVDALVDGADVVVHLAFIIIGDPEEAQRINTEGSRNVFEAAVAAGAERLVYTSSVAAYGFHADNPQPLTEEVPPRGSEDFYYSAHKAELERVLDECVAGSGDRGVRLPPLHRRRRRGADADRDDRSPAADLRPAPARPPGARPDPVPRPGAARSRASSSSSSTRSTSASALRAAVEGAGAPGRYNLAGPGSMSIARMARACGWWSVPIPGAAVAALSEVANRIPGLPPEVEWLNAFRAPTMMDTRKAREELGWAPEWDAEATMRETVSGAREAGVL